MIEKLSSHDILWNNSTKLDDGIFENQKRFQTEYGIMRRTKEKPYWYLNPYMGQHLNKDCQLDHQRVFLSNIDCHLRYIVVRSEYATSDYSEQGWKKNTQSIIIKVFPYEKEEFLQ